MNPSQWLQAAGNWLVGLRSERAPFLWSFLYFFCLIAAYYVVRPLREEMGVRFGPERLHWLFTATLICMLLLTPVYGALVASIRKRLLVPCVYGFFIGCLFVFHRLLQHQDTADWVAPSFFVWVSVFNLFVVSVFWSLMSDVWDAQQAKRLFGIIAAGGTAGGIVGPRMTAVLAEPLGVHNLLLVSAALLGICLLAVLRLAPAVQSSAQRQGKPGGDHVIGGHILGGARLVFSRPLLLGIASIMALGVFVGGILYLQQSRMVAGMGLSSEARTAYFANIDVSVNVLTLLGQLLLSRWLNLRFGLALVLALPAVLMAVGMLSLAAMPYALVLAGVQVLTRAGRFSLLEPGLASLYTQVDEESRYKAKSFIDTVIYRVGDVGTAWIVNFLSRAGLTLSGFALIAAGASGLLFIIALWLGRQHEEKLRKRSVAAPLPQTV